MGFVTLELNARRGKSSEIRDRDLSVTVHVFYASHVVDTDGELNIAVSAFSCVNSAMQRFNLP